MKTFVLNLTLFGLIFLSNQSNAQVSIKTDSVCLKTTSTLTVLGIADNEIKSCIWDLDDNGSHKYVTGKSITYEFSQSGNNSVHVVITKNDLSTITFDSYSFVYPIPAPNFQINNLCEGESATFIDLSTINSGRIVQRTWDFYDNNIIDGLNDSIAHFSCGSAKSYSTRLEVTSDKGCSTFTIKSTKVFANPKVDFSVPVICADAPATLTNFINNNGVPINLFLWKFNDGTASTNNQPTHIFTSAGQEPVTLIVINDGACSDTITKMITINPKPSVIITGDTAMVNGRPTMFTATGSPASYQWSHGQNTASVNPMNNQLSYTVTATDDNGCTNTASIVLTEGNNNNTNYNSISKVITANGDGINDYLNVTNFQTPVTIVIYDTWGNQVYSSSDYKNDWYATDVDAGSYYYIIKNSPDDIKGNINVLK